MVRPKEGGVDGMQETWRELLREDLQIIYSVEEVLRHADVDIHLLSKHLERVPSFPFVAAIPEGHEAQYAERLRHSKRVGVAIPNYYIKPSQPDLEINTNLLTSCFDSLDCQPRGGFCGSDVKVAVLDSGINRSLLPTHAKINGRQFDVSVPERGWSDLEDRQGHGTLVAHIISRIAPGAELASIKVMGDNGTVGGLISALFLAEAELQPDIYNLSLSVSVDTARCEVCGTSREPDVTTKQLQLLFDIFNQRRGNQAFVVAAAGNGTGTIAVPACFDSVLAVGSFDFSSQQSPRYSQYQRVPSTRFIRGPGGLRDAMNCVAKRKGLTSYDFFYGTSFSAAFISGIACRYLCAMKDGPCATPLGRKAVSNGTSREFVLACLSKSANRQFPGFAEDRDGLGIAKYDWKVAL